MKLAARLILVLSFCLGALGAAGMGARPKSPSPAALAGEEDRSTLAWGFLLTGLGGVAAGGLAERRLRRVARGAGPSGAASRLGDFAAVLRRVAINVAALDTQRPNLSCGALRDAIEALFARDYFDLTTRHEEVLEVLGFSRYARLWEPIAAAERRLARVWTLATDGELAETAAELSAARRHLERAVAELEAV
jgi:hypothetical protein